MPGLVMDLELAESQGKDDFDAIVLKSFLGPGCYHGMARTVGWHLSLYLQLHSPDYDEPFWEDWKISGIGWTDKTTSEGGWNIFPCNAVDAAGVPDIDPNRSPGDLEIVEAQADWKGYNYRSETLCRALLQEKPSGENAGVDHEKLQASPFIGTMPYIWSEKGKLRTGTRFSVLKKSLLDCNFPPNTMTSNFTWLVGIEGHWNQLDPPRDYKGKGTILGLTQFKGHDPAKAAQLLSQMESTVAVPAVVPAAPVAVAPVAAPMAPVAVAPVVAAPVVVPPALGNVTPVPAPVPAPVDVTAFLQAHISTQLEARPKGFPAGTLATMIVDRFTNDPKSKSEALDLLRGGAAKRWGTETGRWKMSDDGVTILPV